MKIEIPNQWLNSMTNMHESKTPKEIAEVVNHSWNDNSKLMLQISIGKHILQKLEYDKYEP